jgi:hypothetical protein
MNESLAALSRLINRPEGYLGRWVREGKPEWLESPDRKKLARYLGIDETEIGWPDPEAEPEDDQAPHCGPSESGYQSRTAVGALRTRG